MKKQTCQCVNVLEITTGRKSVGNTSLFGGLCHFSIERGIVVGESAAQRLQALAQLKLEPGILAEVSDAKHPIGTCYSVWCM